MKPTGLFYICLFVQLSGQLDGCGSATSKRNHNRIALWERHYLMAFSHCSLVAFSASSLAFFFGSDSAAIWALSSASCALSCSSKEDLRASASGCRLEAVRSGSRRP